MATLTTQEWIEYYRFHPSEFEAFIKFTEGIAAERDALKEALVEAHNTVNDMAYFTYDADMRDSDERVVKIRRVWDIYPFVKINDLLAKLEATK